MEIRQLEAFAAVLTAGSVTAAGRLLERSQQVVSRQIQDLEQRLGFTLFHRTRPHVKLTDKGREFYEEVRPILAGLEVLDARARDIAQGLSRPLRVAATPSLSLSILPQVIALLEGQQAFFQQKLFVDSLLPDEVIKQVSEGKVDVGLTSLPVDLGANRLHWSGQAPYMLALPVGHALAGHEVIDLSSVEDQMVVSVFHRYRMRYRQATALVRAHTHSESLRRIETASSVNVLSMVRVGLGVGILDPYLAACYPLEGVVVREIQNYIPAMIGVVSHADRPLHAEAPVLIEALRQYVVESIPRFIMGDDSGLPQEPESFSEFPASE